MTHDELAARLRDGDVVVVDVRPGIGHEPGHISGAPSLPLAELSAQLKQIPKDLQVVAYCRGPFGTYPMRSGRRAPKWHRISL